MIHFEILEQQLYHQLKITLEDDAVQTESGQLSWSLGEIEMEAKAPSITGFFKSLLTSEKMIRPIYQGKGEIWLEPSFDNFTVVELQDEQWIIDQGCYVASELSLELELFQNKMIGGLLSDEGYFQTKVSGTGKLVISSPGPIQTIDLAGRKLTVDGNFAVARQECVTFEVAKSSRKLLSTLFSGEGLVNTFSGEGKVMIAPVPGHLHTLEQRFATLREQNQAILKRPEDK
ncbi:AIM24 family protein [Dongshaea marina]|uniref:AIM24 family protein n=1 Tax=Dongshaea marina TaxID=2047966 RepID=UPI000D3E88A6|nr:AIM24 family protein [Dongshaea marina]